MATSPNMNDVNMTSPAERKEILKKELLALNAERNKLEEEIKMYQEILASVSDLSSSALLALICLIL